MIAEESLLEEIASIQYGPTYRELTGRDREPNRDGCGTDRFPKAKHNDGSTTTGGAVLEGRVLCPDCWDIARAEHLIIVAPGLPEGSMLDGVTCGTMIVLPKYNMPSTRPPGYGGQSKMTAYLPGGSKFTGAQLAGLGYAPGAAGPTGRKPSAKPAAKPANTPPTLTSPAAAIATIDQLRERIRELESIVATQKETMRLQRVTMDIYARNRR